MTKVVYLDAVAATRQRPRHISFTQLRYVMFVRGFSATPSTRKI